MTEEKEKELDTLQQQLGLNRKELIETALDILAWIVKKRRLGRTFYALDQNNLNDGNATKLQFRGLERVRQT